MKNKKVGDVEYFFEHPLKKKNRNKNMIIMSMVVIVLFIVAYYNFMLPIKPELVKPGLTGLDGEYNITKEHVAWLVNELGSYKLNDQAEMEIRIGDDFYTVNIEEHYPIVEELLAENPDIKIAAADDVIVKILESEDTSLAAKHAYDNGELYLEIGNATETELLGKGYIGLYTGITGNFLAI